MKKEMSVLRPEDNVDNDIIVLNKHLVLKKKSQLAKGDLMDVLTGQNNNVSMVFQILTSVKEITLVT